MDLYSGPPSIPTRVTRIPHERLAAGRRDEPVPMTVDRTTNAARSAQIHLLFKDEENHCNTYELKPGIRQSRGLNRRPDRRVRLRRPEPRSRCVVLAKPYCHRDACAGKFKPLSQSTLRHSSSETFPRTGSMLTYHDTSGCNGRATARRCRSPWVHRRTRLAFSLPLSPLPDFSYDPASVIPVGIDAPSEAATRLDSGMTGPTPGTGQHRPPNLRLAIATAVSTHHKNCGTRRCQLWQDSRIAAVVTR